MILILLPAILPIVVYLDNLCQNAYTLICGWARRDKLSRRASMSEGGGGGCKASACGTLGGEGF
jgi:hypothetical protein